MKKNVKNALALSMILAVTGGTVSLIEKQAKAFRQAI